MFLGLFLNTSSSHCEAQIWLKMEQGSLLTQKQEDDCFSITKLEKQSHMLL